MLRRNEVRFLSIAMVTESRRNLITRPIYAEDVHDTLRTGTHALALLCLCARFHIKQTET